MTRQDFQLIADVLNRGKVLEHGTRQVQWNAALDYAARSFAVELAQTNPRFNKAEFLTACGVTE